MFNLPKIQPWGTHPMTVIHVDAVMPDAERRARLYEGDLFVYSPRPASVALCTHARQMVEEAFAPQDPRRVHEALAVEQCVQTLAVLKPHFIHHPRSKQLLQEVLSEFGCDPDSTYFDVPRLRTAMPKDYLTAGIAYAFHPHRDTWYSAPSCQLNWWLPIYELEAQNCMAFHPRYWREGVRNSSHAYNYDRWKAESRMAAAKHIKEDTRTQPHAEEAMELAPDIRLLCQPGAVILFSAAQMHSTVPNTTASVRYSIDFRTINIEDATNRRGALNVDSACTGTTMRDYMRVRDLAHVPESIVAHYEDRALAEATAR
jgi:hypothetical protein